MNKNTLGDLVLDLTDLQRAEVKSSEGKHLWVTCVVVKNTSTNMVKILSNYENMSAEATITVSDDKTTVSTSCDEDNGGVTRKLPIPNIIDLTTDTLMFGTVLKNNNASDVMHIYSNNSYTQKAVIENDANAQIASATILGDRISGFVSCDCSDEIKLQILCLVLAVLVTTEIKSGSTYGVIGRILERVSVIGTLGHAGVSDRKMSLADLLRKATGDK